MSARAVTSLLVLSSLIASAPARPARADVGWNGFVEAAYGLKTSGVRFLDGPTRYSLKETRAQLQGSAFGEQGEAFLRLDVLHDPVDSEETALELREGFLRFRTVSDHVDVKAGRQALTWGTGDLLFINDLFPKDWVSFLIGRDDEYLKAPADAIRLGLFGLPMDVDLVLVPEFTPDNTPTGARLAAYMPPGVAGAPIEPSPTLGHGEIALRLSRYVGSITIAAYGYRGFHKAPLGLTPASMPYYPELSVYGASARGPALGGVGWIEAGYYDSSEDRDGTDPSVPNSSIRVLVGHSRQPAGETTLGAQYYAEGRIDHDAYVANLPAGVEPRDEWRQLLTLRAERFFLYQTLRVSLFGFLSPTDEDLYLRGFASYKVSDDIAVTLGTNVFAGEEHTTQFGQFEENDNIYTRLRYSF